MLNVLQAEQRRCRRPKRLHLRRRWVRRQQPAMSQQCGSIRPGQGCLDKNNGHVGKEVWSWCVLGILLGDLLLSFVLTLQPLFVKLCIFNKYELLSCVQ